MRLPLLFSLTCVVLCGSAVNVGAKSVPIPPDNPAAQVVAFAYAPDRIAHHLRTLSAPAGPETLAAVVRLSVHSAAEVRVAAIQALSRFGNADAAARPLIAALADVDPQVQQEAVRALGVLKVKAAVPQLTAIITMTKRTELRAEAEQAVRAISGN